MVQRTFTGKMDEKSCRVLRISRGASTSRFNTRNFHRLEHINRYEFGEAGSHGNTTFHLKSLNQSKNVENYSVKSA